MHGIDISFTSLNDDIIDIFKRINNNDHLSGPEVRVLKVFRDDPLHLVLGAGVKVLVSEPHPKYVTHN